MVEGPFKKQLAAFTDKLTNRVTDSPSILNSLREEGSRLQNSFFGLGRLRYIGDLTRLSNEINGVEARTQRYQQTLETLEDMRWFDAKPFSDNPQAFVITARVKHPDSVLLEELRISLRIPQNYNPSNAPGDLSFQGKTGSERSEDNKKSVISMHRVAALADPYTRIVHELFFKNSQPAAEVAAPAVPQPISA